MEQILLNMKCHRNVSKCLDEQSLHNIEAHGGGQVGKGGGVRSEKFDHKNATKHEKGDLPRFSDNPKYPFPLDF
jgi:hypothetical protein